MEENLRQLLCARLPYGVKVRDELGIIHKLTIGNSDLVRLYYDDFSIYSESQLSLPLLRPMSSMTEEEKKEFEDLWDKGFSKALDAQISNSDDYVVRDLEIIASSNAIDWLNQHYFDFRGLITKGLAIEVTKKNNPYK